MSESSLSLVLIFAELGGVLFLLLIGWIIYYLFGIKKEGETTQGLIKYIKEIIPTQKDKLITHFKTNVDLEQDEAHDNIKSLMEGEKKLYERLIKVSVSKDMSLLKLTVNDINKLVNDYVKMLTLKGKDLSNKTSDSRELILRKENDAFRLEVTSLKTRLTLSEETIENMMGEFSSMYEGGKKEGEQRLKNDMYQLKQSLKEEEVKVKSEITNIDKNTENS